jgi:hypothetical protein
MPPTEISNRAALSISLFMKLPDESEIVNCVVDPLNDDEILFKITD